MGSITFDNVTKLYGKEVGIQKISMEIYEDEFFVILGPSGAGKTTILKVIAGLLKITEGDVYINDQLVNNISPADRNVAMTFETYALYPHYNIFDNIANPLRSPKMNMDEEDIKKRVKRMAEMLGIEMLLDRYPRELSGGQKQRVSLGRAMVREPAVFLLDEPLSHVDAKVRHKMRVELNKLQKELNATTVYVTHDYIEGLSLADRIAVLNKGQIIQIDKPEVIYNNPLNEFVATHVGQPEMNIFDTTVMYKDGNTILLSDKNNKIQFKLTGEKSKLLNEKGIGSVRAGIRPHHIHITSVQEGDIKGEVFVYEPFVTYGVLTVSVSGEKFVVLTKNEETYSIGQYVGLKINSEDIYLFDKTSKKNLEYV